MIRRCHVETDPSYKWYGARGIKVCDRWRNDYQAFKADMGPRPSRKYSIDRIDGTKGYEPGNCRWATAMEQSANTVSNSAVEAVTLPPGAKSSYQRKKRGKARPAIQ